MNGITATNDPYTIDQNGSDVEVITGSTDIPIPVEYFGSNIKSTQLEIKTEHHKRKRHQTIPTTEEVSPCNTIIDGFICPQHIF